MRNLARATITQVFTAGNELCKHIDVSISYIIIVKQRCVFLEDFLEEVLMSEGNIRPSSVFTDLP